MNKIFLSFVFVFLSFFFVSSIEAKELLNDEFIENQLQDKELSLPQQNSNYNYEDLRSVKIKLNYVGKPITTKSENVYDGMQLNFVVKNNVVYNRKTILKQGTPVKAKVSLFRSRGMNGIPGAIIIEDFDIPNIEDGKLLGVYQKTGQDRTLWLLPIKWALTILWPSGYFVNFIVGGHAKLTEKDVITLQYYPNWATQTVTSTK